jgi:putative sterol carrier protein
VHTAALATGLWHEAQVEHATIEAHEEISWTAERPVVPDDVLVLETTVVRMDPEPGGLHGRVTWHHELRDASGRVVGSGLAIDVLRARNALTRKTNRDVGTLAWGEAMAETLTADEVFAGSVGTWDGTLGLRSGDREVQLRIYRGRIIEVTRRTAHGATFTLGADDHTWVDVLTAEEQIPFGVLLMTGAFEVSGDPYEYLRLTKALEIIVDHARSYARGAEQVR